MKEYRLGSRFFKCRNLCLILAAIVVFAFYFIYDYVFSASVQWWNADLMAFVFLAVGVFFLGLIWAGANQIYQNVSCSLSHGCLVCAVWKQSRQYPIQSFRRASLGAVSFSAVLPVIFELEDGRTLQLNQYMEELPELTAQLLQQIAPFAEIDPRLRDYMDC